MFLKSLVINSIQPFIDPILVNEQHSFHSFRFSIINSLVFCNYITSHVKYRSQVDVIHLDLEKSFDHVSHPVLSVLQTFDIGLDRISLTAFNVSIYLASSLSCKQFLQVRLGMDIYFIYYFHCFLMVSILMFLNAVNSYCMQMTKDKFH